MRRRDLGAILSCPMWRRVERHGEVYSTSTVERDFQQFPSPRLGLMVAFLYPKV